MADLAEWNNHQFKVNADVLRSFKDLTIKGATTTKDKTSDKQTYVTRKSGSATEVTLTAILNQNFGVNVKKEAMEFVNEAADGKSAYFYMNGSKLVTCKMMLTAAQVEKIEMTANGVWTSCEVGLTLKQSGKFETNGSSSSTTKKKTTKQTKTK